MPQDMLDSRNSIIFCRIWANLYLNQIFKYCFKFISMMFTRLYIYVIETFFFSHDTLILFKILIQITSVLKITLPNCVLAINFPCSMIYHDQFPMFYDLMYAGIEHTCQSIVFY